MLGVSAMRTYYRGPGGNVTDTHFVRPADGQSFPLEGAQNRSGRA